jgi:uncharacterized delta-60 repeat protein
MMMRAITTAIGVLAAATVAAGDGAPDTTFGNGGVAYMALDGVEGHHIAPHAIAVRPNGAIVLGGWRNLLVAGTPDPRTRAMVARLAPDGTPDPTFGTHPELPGLAVLPDIVIGSQMQMIEAMHVYPDGSIVVAGSCFAFAPMHGFIAKLRADGSPDPDFGNSGVVLFRGLQLHDLGIDSAGRIVAAGEQVGGTPQYRGAVVRVTAQGARDAAFGTDGVATLVQSGADQLGYFRALAILPDDRIVTGGTFQVPDPNFVDNYDLSIARWKTDGTLDPTFAGDGWRTFNVAGTSSAVDGIDRLVVAPRGKIVFAGHYEVGGESGTNVVFGRLDAAGADDATFGDAATPGFRTIDPPVAASWNENASGLVRQSDGKFVASISYTVFDPDRESMAAVRLTADGALDSTFATGGLFNRDLGHGGHYDDAMTVTLDAGRVLLAGRSAQPPGGGFVDMAVTRLENDGIFSDGHED